MGSDHSGPLRPEQRADVTGATLDGARLDGANLTRARMRNVTSLSVTLVPASGSPRQPARLGRSGWRGLTRANLEGAGVEVSNFGGADLTRANLRGGGFGWSDFDAAVFERTICPDGTSSDDNGGACNLEPVIPLPRDETPPLR